MKTFIKKYWTHIFNIMFFVYIIGVMNFFANNMDVEINSIITPLILLGITFVFVIGLWIELIYYMIKALKNDELKNKGLAATLIYALNLFYIPCFVLKHMYKDKHAKLKNAIYIIVSVALYIILIFVIFKFSFNQDTYTQYISEDNVISVSVPSNYRNDKIVGQFDMYFRSSENFNVGIFFYDDFEESAEEILEFQKEQLEETRKNYKVLKSDSKNKNGKEINTCYVKGKYKGEQQYYYLATITFDEKEDYIVYVMGFSLDDTETNRKEFESILDKVKLN